MDHIDTYFTTVSQDLKYSSAIHALVALGKTHISKYYNMTGNSEVYWITMNKWIF